MTQMRVLNGRGRARASASESLGARARASECESVREEIDGDPQARRVGDAPQLAHAKYPAQLRVVGRGGPAGCEVGCHHSTDSDVRTATCPSLRVSPNPSRFCSVIHIPPLLPCSVSLGHSSLSLSHHPSAPTETVAEANTQTPPRSLPRLIVGGALPRVLRVIASSALCFSGFDVTSSRV